MQILRYATIRISDRLCKRGPCQKTHTVGKLRRAGCGCHRDGKQGDSCALGLHGVRREFVASQPARLLSAIAVPRLRVTS